MALKNNEKQEISNRYKKGETEEDIAKAMDVSINSVSKYKDYSPKKPSSSGDTEEETAHEGALTEDDIGGEVKNLDRIISEVSLTKRRPGIVRMVSYFLGDDEKSILGLDEALRLSGGVDPSQRKLIVRNWASHLEVDDLDEILKKGRKAGAEEEKKKSEEKKKPEDDKEEKKKTPTISTEEALKKVHDRRLTRLDSLQIQKEIADMEKEMGAGKEEKEGKEEEKHTMIVDGVSLKLTASEILGWKRYLLEQKRAEEEREERKEERKQQEEERKEERKERQQLDDEKHSQNDGGLVEWVIGEGNNTRTIKVRPETIPFLVQAQGAKNPSQNPSMDREDVMQMVERTIEAQTKKLTPDDVERIIRRNMGEYRPGSLTKNDLLYLEAKDKLRLEERKLDESGKTRDVIGDAIRGGFSHAGQIVSRMMTEEGAAGGTQVEGYSNQAENMMQVPCPGCNTIITAPIGSPMVTCPKCGKRWAVEHPGYDQIPSKVERKKPPVEDFIPKEKEVIQKSMEDAKKDMMKPLETSEPMIDVEKTAEGIAIGEAATKLEGELKKKKALEELRQRNEEENERKRKISSKKVEEDKESPVEKKPWPKIDSNICPICSKKCKGKRGVAAHIVYKHPEYKK